jgi:hypothetical protein
MIKSINTFVTTSAMFAEFAYLGKKIQQHDIIRELYSKRKVWRENEHTLSYRM